MPSFGERSTASLDTVDLRLVRVLDEAIKHFDFSVLEGHRPEREQNEAYDAGRSQRLWPTGSHNSMPSKAVDVAPYPIDWEDAQSFVYLAGCIVGIGAFLGVRIRYGGDWNSDRKMADETFRDLGHLELDE